MENSSYKVVLTSDATRGSTRYLKHYGVKGMKWGVVHDEDEKRRAQSYSVQSMLSNNPSINRSNVVGPVKPRIEYNRERMRKLTANSPKPPQTSFEQEMKNATKEFTTFISDKNNREMMKEGLTAAVEMAASPQVQESMKKTLAVASEVAKTPEARKLADEFTEGAREGAREAFEKNKAQSLGDVVDKITSDEYREDVNFLQDLVIDELEERNPVVGQAARAVDNFLDGIDSFISDFVKSANKIVGDIMAWGKSLFGG